MNADSAKLVELKKFTDKLLLRFADRVLRYMPDNADKLADLATRMTYYAVKGDQRGMDAVVGRFAGLALQVKLETESAAVEILKTIGDALMDAASHFLPRLMNTLLGDEKAGDPERGHGGVIDP